MKQLRIYNGFGIKPTNTHVSAGMDFYVPDMTSRQDEASDKTRYDNFINGMMSSHNVNERQLETLMHLFKKHLMQNVVDTQLLNVIQLYLSLYSYDIESFKEKDIETAVIVFVNDYLVFDKNNVAGVRLRLNDTLFVNSGIKVALDPGKAGIFFNKSGKGNAGFDVRACVVDEDYAGYVHLSVAMTKKYYKDGKNIVYCGDKLTQMVVLPVEHLDPTEISLDAYDEIMKDSARGAAGFGSSDVKH